MLYVTPFKKKKKKWFLEYNTYVYLYKRTHYSEINNPPTVQIYIALTVNRSTIIPSKNDSERSFGTITSNIIIHNIDEGA